MKRFLPILVTLALSAVFVPAALADSSTSSTPSVTSSTPTTTTSTPTTTTTTTDVTPPSTTTTTTAAPPTTTTTTAVPTTTATTTNVPTTTTTAVPPTTTTTTTDGSNDSLLPSDVGVACTAATCIPANAGGTSAAVGAGTGRVGALPFTGVSDMIAPVLLALTVLLGGVVAWRWAQLRESVARDADVALVTPARTKHSGYQQAMRMQAIERRARTVFEHRVA